MTVVCHSTQKKATEMGRFFGMAQATLPKLYNLHSSPCTEMVKKGVWYMKQIMKQEIYIQMK
jgi:hypothetical protein